MRLQHTVESLESVATQARKLIIETVHYANEGHLGGSLSSATNILIVLYFQVMNINPERPLWEDRDRECVAGMVEAGTLTPDMGGTATTEQVGQAVRLLF